jgi:hypothetical protein
MALAMICTWWKFASPIEVYIEAQFANRGGELRRELAFVISVDVSIEFAEIVLNLFVDLSKGAKIGANRHLISVESGR